MAATTMRSRWKVLAAVLSTIFVGILCRCGMIASPAQELTTAASNGSLLTQQQLQQNPPPSWLKGGKGDHSPRSLQDDEAQGNLFWTFAYCPRSDNNQYQTVRVWWLFAWLYDIFSRPRDGDCGELCRELCRHGPCVPDFEAPDREICFCFPDKSDTLCGKNTKCVEDEDDYQDVGTCQCQDDGYGGDPVLRTSPDGGCTDIDECALGDVCGPNGECENSVGSFRCNCALGYFWEPPQGGCKDRDECEQDTAPCGPNGVCTNTPGSFTCGCEPGFTGDPLNGDNCKDIDECVPNNPCGVNSISCNNQVPGYSCDCQSGYTDIGGTCRKLREYEACPSGNDNDCETGLKCAKTSFSDQETTTCCSRTLICNVNEECCVGVYESGDRCPSELDSDCRGNLRCAWRTLVDPTFVCCQNTLPVPLVSSARYCI